MLMLVYYLVVSLLTFALFGIDKHSAGKHGRRIPEKSLIALSLLGGGMGGWIAMRLFRHKTRHVKFKILVPLGAVLWTAATALFMVLPLIDIASKI